VFVSGMNKWLLRSVYIIIVCATLFALPMAKRLYEPIQQNNLAVQALEQKQYDRAIEYLSQARQAKPDDSVIQRNLAVAYNSKALELEQQGKELEAITYYKKSLSLDPSNPIVTRNLVASLNNLAVTRSKAKEFLEAQKLFEEACSRLETLHDDTIVSNVRSNYAGLLTVWGYELLRHNKPQEAADAFRQALKLNKNNAVAMIYLGDIAYDLNDYDTARSFYSAARALDSENASYLDSRLTMIEKEAKLENLFRSFKDPLNRFRLQYVPYSGGVEVSQVLAMLNEAMESVGQQLGLYPNRSVNVKIYRSQDFFKVSALPEWATGIYDGKMRLKVEDMQNAPSQVRDLLFHEYTHAVLAMNIRHPLPAWFHEGMAQLMEPQFSQSIREQRRVHAALADRQVTFESLQESFKDIRSKEEAENAYLLSKYFLASLKQKYGDKKLREWLALMAQQDEKFESAFEKVYGVSLKKAQDSWIREQLDH